MDDEATRKRSDAAYEIDHLLGAFELTCGFRAVSAFGALAALLGEHGHQLNEKQRNSLSVHLERAVRHVCRSVQPYADINLSTEPMSAITAKITVDTTMLRKSRGQRVDGIDEIRNLLGDQAADELEAILNRGKLH
ncbi:MAG: hypothetical protein AB7L09_03230 [Nitrospira sp.]